MAQLSFNEILKELFVAADQQIVIIDTISKKTKNVIKIPLNLLELAVNEKDQNNENDDEDEEKATNVQQNNEEKLKNLQVGKISIQNFAVAVNGKYFAVSTSGIKTLILYGRKNVLNGDDFEWQMLSVRKCDRASTVISFSSSSEILVLCDRTGDCFLYDCENYLLPKKWILGHLSSIYDVKFAPDGKYILTADRDEKVRVTNFPDSYEIENYCLGHTEYVCSIEILPLKPNFLITMSGDKTIRVWNWKEGIQLYKHEISAPGIKMTIRTIEENAYELGVLVFQPNNCLYIYRLEIDNNKISIEEKKSIFLQNSIVTNIIYVENILVASINNNDKLQIELFESDLGEKSEIYKDLKVNIEKEFSNQTVQELEDIAGWFKKKFDNVSDYMQRKRQRIEDKNSKKNL